ncbi:hypothetical protein BP5796_05534 [Coleophoma crateriformis]|uniref:Aminotransferase class I/classII large domain-containing protein n=1 Tax=Coleophoma crateriformis TaxID=565419 RepID=A0A3D8S3J8_9HELO|nr:hypothetical protein BP5796_05534 [Coleophoma crateriformis]
MSLSHREGLVRLARKHNALIVTDDVYDFLQWPTDNTPTSALKHALLPRLVDIDRTLAPVPGPEEYGNAVSNGSFSKIAGPGMRTGWADASLKFTYGLSQCGSSRSGGAPSQVSATIMCELMKNGQLVKHIIEVLQPAYQRRWKIMMDALATHIFPLGLSVRTKEIQKTQQVFGGYFIWLDLPDGIDAEGLVSHALKSENLIVAAGPMFEVEGDASVKFAGSLRLCFAWEEEEDLKAGVERLGRAVKRYLDGGVGSEKGLSGSGFKQSMGEFQ